MQVKNATRKGRFTFFDGAWNQSGSVVTIHVHHWAETLV